MLKLVAPQIQTEQGGTSMRAKAALLTMTIALIIITGLTGCGSTSKKAHQHYYGPNGIRSLNTNDPYYANRYNTNSYGDGFRPYNMGGMGGYRGYYDGPYGYNYGYPYMDGQRYGVHSAHKMRMRQKIADRLVSLNGVKSAYVMSTKNNIYVAVVPDRRTTDYIPSMLKKRVCKVVKREAPNYKNIFVSANPDFIDWMREYREKSVAGHPLSGLIDEFREVVERTFPTNVTNQMR